MSISHRWNRRLLRVGAGGVGAFAAGLGAARPSDAAVDFTPVDADIPATGKYTVNLNGDTLNEFYIQRFASVTKVAFDKANDVPTSTTALVDYGVWRTHYGEGEAAVGASLNSIAADGVPEPSTLIFVVGAVVPVACRGRRRRFGRRPMFAA